MEDALITLQCVNYTMRAAPGVGEGGGGAGPTWMIAGHNVNEFISEASSVNDLCRSSQQRYSNDGCGKFSFNYTRSLSRV